jgi:alkylhydroperoxidase/carboxymuconolactone decarboxylase family protein YurZ
VLGGCAFRKYPLRSASEELRSHIAGALNVGISREEIVEVIMHTSIYAGGGAAMRVAADVLGTD